MGTSSPMHDAPAFFVGPTGLSQNSTVLSLHGHKLAFMGTSFVMHDFRAIFVGYLPPTRLSQNSTVLSLHGHKLAFMGTSFLMHDSPNPLPVWAKIPRFFCLSWPQIRRHGRKLPHLSFSSHFHRAPFTGLNQKSTIFPHHGHKLALMGTSAPMHYGPALRGAPPTGFSEKSTLLAFTYYPEKAEATSLRCKIPRAKQSVTYWKQDPCNARILQLSATRRNKLIDAMQGRFRHAEQRSQTGGKVEAVHVEPQPLET